MAKKAIATLIEQSVEGTALRKSLGLMTAEGLPPEFFQRMIDDSVLRHDFVRWACIHRRRYDLILPGDRPAVPKGYEIMRHTPMSGPVSFAPSRCDFFSYWWENYSDEAERGFNDDERYQDTLCKSLAEVIEYAAGANKGELLNACFLDFLVRYPKRYPAVWKDFTERSIIFAGTVFRCLNNGVKCCRYLRSVEDKVFYGMVEMGDFLTAGPAIATYHMPD
jgi:hypothetical protein